LSGFTHNRATWYCWLLTGFYLYSVNLQGNVVFLQAEFALSYRAVSLHSSAIAVRDQVSEEQSARLIPDS
jgi:hypothetical protein